MKLRTALLLMTAAACASCSTTTREPVASDVAPPPPPPTTYPSEQAELDHLRAENARLRSQLQGATRETAVMRQEKAVTEVRQQAVDRGELQPGMTVNEAVNAVTGDPKLYRDTCELLSSSDTEWVYRVRSARRVAGPMSGGVSPLATNMRGELPAPVDVWVCTFDAPTGKLKAFRRDVP